MHSEPMTHLHTIDSSIQDLVHATADLATLTQFVQLCQCRLHESTPWARAQPILSATWNQSLGHLWQSQLGSRHLASMLVVNTNPVTIAHTSSVSHTTSHEVYASQQKDFSGTFVQSCPSSSNDALTKIQDTGRASQCGSHTTSWGGKMWFLIQELNTSPKFLI